MYVNCLMLMMLSTLWLTENNVFYLYEIPNNLFVSFMTLSSIFRHRPRKVSKFGKLIKKSSFVCIWRDSGRLSPFPLPLWLCGNMCPPCVMWSVNIEPFLRWWRLRALRRHHGGAMKEWQWCTQTVHSSLWEKNMANSFTSPSTYKCYT